MTKNALNQEYIGFFSLKPGNVLLLKCDMPFHKPTNGVSLGRMFSAETCLTVLELSKPEKTYDGKERKITVLYENQLWHKIVNHVTFPLMFEVIL